jgi:cytochrome c peroxidase
MWRWIGAWWVLVCAAYASGCWASPATTDGFTQPQWEALQQLELPPPPLPCGATTWGSGQDCNSAITLAQTMFFDPSLSSNGTVSCATCHDPSDAYIDPRAENNVSFGATMWTKRNTKSLIDIGYKAMLAPGQPVYTWSGQYTSPGAVLDLAITKAMSSTHAALEATIQTNPTYACLFIAAFGSADLAVPDTIYDDLVQAFDAYLSTIIAPPAPFDAFLEGDATAISESAQRGLSVFVGSGTCIECHNGPLLSDLQFHNTGVPQEGMNVPAVDTGREEVTMDPADAGKFLTGSLREIGNTAPYMHDGWFATLGDVIGFYNGGSSASYSGTRDPRIVALGLTEQDVTDLQALLLSLDSCSDPATCTFDPYRIPPSTIVSSIPLSGGTCPL